jgi:hypothetical protein
MNKWEAPAAARRAFMVAYLAAAQGGISFQMLLPGRKELLTGRIEPGITSGLTMGMPAGTLIW